MACIWPERVKSLYPPSQIACHNCGKCEIVILNTDGFYDKLLEFFDVIIKREFAHTDSSKIYYVAKSPEEAIEYIKTYSPQETGLKFARA